MVARRHGGAHVRARRGRLTVAAMIALLAGGLGVPSARTAIAAPAGCPNPGKNVPLVFVHGLNGEPTDFTAHGATGTTSLPARLKSLPSVFETNFDYGRVADKWVTIPSIGQSLADYLTCVASASKAAGGIGKVVIVAHSMGGLAVRQALSLQSSGTGVPVAAVVGLLVTVATPNTGSWSDGLFHDGRAGRGGTNVATMTWLLQGVCGGVGAATGSSPTGGRPGICSILQGSTSQAGTAMVPGSAELASLPAPPANLPLDAVAGQLTVTSKLFLVHTTVKLLPSDALGDLLVKPDSALAYGGRPGAHQYLDQCSLAVHELLGNLGWQGCEHGGLLYDDGVGQQISTWIKGWLKQSTGPSTPAGVNNVAFPTGQWRSHASAVNINVNGNVSFVWFVNEPLSSPPRGGDVEIDLRITSVSGTTANLLVTGRKVPQGINPKDGPGFGPDLPIGASYSLTIEPPGVVGHGAGSSFQWCDDSHYGQCGA